eukprot:SAG11_NODE_21761_length_419_cov_0.903125_1_plen_45_part_01
MTYGMFYEIREVNMYERRSYIIIARPRIAAGPFLPDFVILLHRGP